MIHTRRATFALVSVLAIASVACAVTPVHHRAPQRVRRRVTPAPAPRSARPVKTSRSPSTRPMSPAGEVTSRSTTRVRARTSSWLSQSDTAPGDLTVKDGLVEEDGMNVVDEAEDIAPSTTAYADADRPRGRFLRHHLQPARPLRAGYECRAEGLLGDPRFPSDVGRRGSRAGLRRSGPKRFLRAQASHVAGPMERASGTGRIDDPRRELVDAHTEHAGPDPHSIESGFFASADVSIEDAQRGWPTSKPDIED